MSQNLMMKTLMMMVMMVVMMVMVAPTSASIEVAKTSPFCTLVPPDQLHCVFVNTTQGVVLGEVKEGVREVKVESATNLHAVPGCLSSLQVWSSSNVTVEGGELVDTPRSTAPRETPRGPTGRVAMSFGSEISPHMASEGFEYNAMTAENKYPMTANSERTVTASDERTMNADNKYTMTANSEREESNGVKEDCRVNVSITQSKVLWLRGQFENVNLQLSRVMEVSGEMKMLELQGMQIINSLSVKAEEVKLENSNIMTLTQLEVTKRMVVKDVEVKWITRPGLTIGVNSSRSESMSNSSLSNINVGIIHKGAMRVRGGEVSISNMTVWLLGDAAITVETGGKLSLSNVKVLQGSHSSLVLGRRASLILDNFTLVNETIKHLELMTTDSQTAVMPLLALSQPKNPDAEQEFLGFPWYWLVIMAVVGLVAGLVVGTAVMWKHPNLTNVLHPVIYLAELLGRDRGREEGEGLTNETLNHSSLTRQDSGLSSSSFASFTPCKERLSSISVHPSHDPTPSLSAQPSHNRLSVHPSSGPSFSTHPPPDSNIDEEFIPISDPQTNATYEQMSAVVLDHAVNNYLRIK